MKHSDFKTLLKRSLQTLPQEGTDLENTILLASAQAWKKRKRERIPFRRFLVNQVRHVGWLLWSVQGLMLLIFDRMVTRLYGERFWDSPSSVVRLLLCVSTLVSMMALPLLYRSRKYRMQEMESATYFSSAKLLMAKLAAIGIGDLLLLAGMFLTTWIRTSMASGNLTFCLLLPFLILSAAYLYLLGHCSGNGFVVGSIGLGTATILLALVLPGQWLASFHQSITAGMVLCAGLGIFSVQQLRYLLYRSSYTELQLQA